jgi:hypothetical protein
MSILILVLVLPLVPLHILLILVPCHLILISLYCILVLILLIIRKLTLCREGLLVLSSGDVFHGWL